MSRTFRNLAKLLICVTLTCISTIANADFLLNFEGEATGTGRTISGENVSGGFTVFQSFQVDEPWQIDSVGVDGWEVDNPAGVPFTGAIVSDDGTGTSAGDVVFGTGSHNFETDSSSSNWSDADYDVVLEPGQYWYRLSSNDVDFWAAAYFAIDNFSPSYSIRTTNGDRFDSSAIALRISGSVVPEPSTGVIVLTAGLIGLIRRKRS